MLEVAVIIVFICGNYLKIILWICDLSCLRLFKFIIVFVWSYFWYFILCCEIVINIMRLGIEYSGGLFIAETVNYCTFRVPRFRSLKGLMDEITSDFCGPTISNSTYHISAHESVRFRHFIFSLFLGLFVKKSFNLLLKQTLHLQKTNILTLTGEAWYHSATHKTNKFKKIPQLLSQTRYRNTHDLSQTVVFYIGNPPKMVSIQVGELLYSNSSPMIPMMLLFPCFALVTYQPVWIWRALWYCLIGDFELGLSKFSLREVHGPPMVYSCLAWAQSPSSPRGIQGDC